MVFVFKTGSPYNARRSPSGSVYAEFLMVAASGRGSCLADSVASLLAGHWSNYDVKDNRPVNLDIGTIELPITAYASILHRASGVFIFFGTAILLWLLSLSLSGPEGFAQAKDCMSSFVGKFAVWVVAAGLIYHACAGA